MNVVDMLLKRDKRFLFQQSAPDGSGWESVPFPKELMTKVSAASSLLAQRNVRGVILPAGSRIVVKEAARHWPGFAQGFGTFQLRSMSKQPVTLSTNWVAADRVGQTLVASAATHLVRFTVPSSGSDGLDLVLAADAGNPAAAFLGVHQMLDRDELLGRLKGNGVEIGPGPKPQALPTSGRQVRYVEQATPDMWQNLYGKETPTPVDPSLWKRYVVGTADHIPAEPGSLDFIFSSHVVEHLANPLGHFAYWASLLKPDGIVAAVIPDRDGCQDYRFPASSIEEIVAEWRAGDMAVTPEHFRRWGALQMPGSTVEELMASGRSIHVHFYTPVTMAHLLAQTAAQIGFKRFSITNQPNHKDFFVVLER
jgi:SAM-dependent methyltransferase